MQRRCLCSTLHYFLTLSLSYCCSTKLEFCFLSFVLRESPAWFSGFNIFIPLSLLSSPFSCLVYSAFSLSSISSICRQALPLHLPDPKISYKTRAAFYTVMLAFRTNIDEVRQKNMSFLCTEMGWGGFIVN